MKDPKKVREYIDSHMNLLDIMEEYKVSFKYDPRLSDETQFKCAFHGQDNKPSARFYKNTNSCFCWTCKKSWGPLSFIQEKEGLYFSDTVRFIIRKYGIDLSSIPDDPTLDIEKKAPTVSKDSVRMKYIRSRIQSLRKKVEFDKYRALTYAYFLLVFMRSKNIEIESGLEKLENKLDSMG